MFLVFIFRLIYWTGIHRIFSFFYGGSGSIVTFHRVLRESESASMFSAPRTSVITPEYLDSLIANLKNKGYRFLSINDLPGELSTKDKKSGKFLICTFDDGYVDVLQYAYPVMKAYSIPFVIYVSSGFTGRTGFLWWDVISDILKNERTLLLLKEGCIVQYEILPGNRDMLFGIARNCIIRYTKDELFKYKQILNEYYHIDTGDYLKRKILSWDALKIISQDPLCTIGSHSENHLAMKYQREDVVRDEIINCKKLIEKNLGIDADHFAFPYGGPDTVTIRDIEIARSIGFKTVCTTRRTNVFNEHIDYLHSLPRIHIAGGGKADMTRQMLWLSGVLPAVKYNGKKLVF